MERTEQASDMAQCYSDTESDTYSLLDMPRPSGHALMQQALADGRMPELVLEGRANLSTVREMMETAILAHHLRGFTAL
jgi:hypothetical protein